jgi:signal transduction histidine kinase
MGEMIGTLLDFARVRFQGSLPIQRVESDMAVTCRAVIEELTTAHPDHPIRLEAQGDRSGAFDPHRIAQVVSNLVGNALVHGDPEAPIDVMLDGDANFLTLRVRNRGAAIPDQVLSEMFEPFRGNSNGHDGLGLGLFIAREIVRAHEGDITARSSVREGTEFTVRLPKRLKDRLPDRSPASTT